MPLFARPALPTRLDLALPGGSVPVLVRRVARARRYTLRVRSAERDVVLSMPARGSLSAARAFAERHRDWVAARLDTLPERVPFRLDATIPLRGVPHRLVAGPGRSIEPCRAGVLALPEGRGRPLLAWLKRQALGDLSAAVARHAATLGVTPTAVRLKDTRSRWGSCSATGCLCFSWRLVLAPPHVLDYVAAHEVAHLVEMNHSPRFWAVCERLYPGTGAARDWLKAHGAGLHRYG